MTRVDAWMPVWDVRSEHAVDVGAPPDVVFDAVLRTDYGRHPLIRALMAMRAVPAFVFAPREAWRRLLSTRTSAPAGGLLGSAFVLLESSRPQEIVLGLTGRFWTAAGALVPTDPARFRQPVPSGLARATWSFRVETVGSATRLTTETRVLCGDERSRRRFLRYWRLIAIGSGVIRRVVLRQIKDAAERV